MPKLSGISEIKGSYIIILILDFLRNSITPIIDDDLEFNDPFFIESL